jgi:hypothetical protein
VQVRYILNTVLCVTKRRDQTHDDAMMILL